ncbi:MAG: GTP-binding protein [Proteobacteria bacterium]|nr:GTP-binding protein [Pseudomonadota bacterium]MCP4920633.1 GTP-binding protein [Pseudomonadota bacterium]
MSGFLGAGKTTLVRHLLEDAQRRGLRVAVVSNEFGELGIDEALLGDGDEAYVELAGGCVCCKLSDELSETLQMLYEQVQPDRVIVETSGIALPFETQLTFWREPVIAWVSDDAAVVVVDAEQLLEERDIVGTFEDQVGSADLLVLNKVDNVPTDALPALDARLAELGPDTPIVHVLHGRIEPDVCFPPDPQGARAARRASPPATPPHHHEHFSSEEIAVPDLVDEDMIRALVGTPLRVKGFVRTAGGTCIVQGVGRRMELIPASCPEHLLGRIVVIRRGA